MRPDWLELEPDPLVAGERAEAFFPTERERGYQYWLEQEQDGQWVRVFKLSTHTYDEDERELVSEPGWSDALDSGSESISLPVGRPGPDSLIIPEVAEPGTYRLCAGSSPTFCTEVQIVAPEDAGD